MSISMRHLVPDHDYLLGPHPRAYAHRGWHVGDLAGLENSLSAFKRAVKEGYRYLETDVHATSDGVVVVHHDEGLDRTTDSRGLVAALPWRSVATAKIAGREQVCRLEDLLEELPDALINIDVKADSAVGPLVSTLRRAKAFGRVCVASFSEARLRRVRRMAGQELLTAMGPRSVLTLWAWGRMRAPRALGSIRGRLAQVPLRQGWVTVVDSRLIAAAHQRGCEVHAWTIDDASEMHRLLDLGVDGLVTDRPELLREVLAERGAWSPAG